MKHQDTSVVNKKLNVLAVDDYSMQCNGLQEFIKKFDFVAKCDKAYNGFDALKLCSQNNYDVVIVDVEMPEMDGMELTHRLRREHGSVKIIVMTAYENPDDIGAFFDMGISAYLLKCYSELEIEKAIKVVVNGKQFISTDIQEIYDTYLLKKKGIEVKDKQALTKMEIRIVILMCYQLTSEQISYRLGLSKSTIDTHRIRIFKKLKIVNSIGIAIYAIKNRIFNPEKKLSNHHF